MYRAPLLGRSQWFVQRHLTRKSVKERNPICAWTNGIAKNKSVDDLTQAVGGASSLQQACHWSWVWKHGAWIYLYSTPCSIYNSSIEKRKCLVRQSFLKRFRVTRTNERLNFSLTWQASENYLKDHADMVGVQASTVIQEECFSQSAKLSWFI